MIIINCTTAKEAMIVNDFISTGIHNSRKEYLEQVNEVIGTKLDLTFIIEENKKKNTKEVILCESNNEESENDDGT